MSLNRRRIIALLLMIAAALASMRLIDGRVMRTMAKYADQPRQQPHLAPPTGSR